MKQVLRALTIAMIILWLSLGILVVTIVHSVSKINIDIDDPVMDVHDKTLTIQFPFAIKNHGYYKVVDVNLTTVLYEPNGDEVIRGQTMIPLVPEGKEEKAVHNMSFHMEDLISKSEKYMFEDLNLTLVTFVSISFEHMVSFHAKYNTTFNWGAPLYNLSIGKIMFRDINETSCELSFPLSFENHSPYLAVSGTIKIEIYNGNHEKIGESVELIDVQSNSVYYKHLSILVDSTKVTPSGTIQLSFQTSMFDFGPLVFEYETV